MKIRNIFDVFSRRSQTAEQFVYKVPPSARRRILLYCRDLFANSHGRYGGEDQREAFMAQVQQMLLYRHGRFQLTGGDGLLSPAADVTEFLLTCEDSEFLDFVEYIFRVDCLSRIQMDENAIVAELNELLATESVGYELTQMVKEATEEPINHYPMFGRIGKVTKTIAFPKVIRKDSQIEHTAIVEPALSLLNDPKYATANQEYLEALEDYRKGDYGDCLTKCGSAFESVMKILCDGKRWKYNQSNTASPLVRTIVANTKIDPYFESLLLSIATLRNKFSKSHGAGVTPRTASRNVARYGLNLTAAAIVFLTNETT